jgi:ABC-type uncharacterized transport system substrate-binding protein
MKQTQNKITTEKDKLTRLQNNIKRIIINIMEMQYFRFINRGLNMKV